MDIKLTEEVSQRLYLTGFAKTGLIDGIRNCSYSPFHRQSHFLTPSLYVHTVIILGELY